MPARKFVRKVPSGLTPSPQQKAIWDCLRKSDCNVVINALAGTGKTTTIVEGLKRIMHRYRNSSICFLAFNRSIAHELQTRVPPGVIASTCHSYGLSVLTRVFGRLEKEDYKVSRLVEEAYHELKGTNRRPPFLVRVLTETLVSHCKSFLLDGTESDIDLLVSHFCLESEGFDEPYESDVRQLVPVVLQQCAEKTATIDYDDMIWLPLKLELPLEQFDLVLVDEAQDLNRARQELALRSARRVVIVGDKFQAIYGFTGADVDSIKTCSNRMLEIGSKQVEHYPLNTTYRCPKKHVELARLLVPEIEHAPEASPGKIELLRSLPSEELQPGDMVLCRVNAPLVRHCYDLISKGIPANIVGRDIGSGLVSLVRRLRVTEITALLRALDDWYEREVARIQSRKRVSQSALIAASDRRACIVSLSNRVNSVQELILTIQNMFQDVDQHGQGKRYVRFSSVHRAKGLESERVFILEGNLMPHPLAKNNWEVEQERNIAYVAVTRSKSYLAFVGSVPQYFSNTLGVEFRDPRLNNVMDDLLDAASSASEDDAEDVSGCGDSHEDAPF